MIVEDIPWNISVWNVIWWEINKTLCVINSIVLIGGMQRKMCHRFFTIFSWPRWPIDLKRLQVCHFMYYGGLHYQQLFCFQKLILYNFPVSINYFNCSTKVQTTSTCTMTKLKCFALSQNSDNGNKLFLALVFAFALAFRVIFLSFS